MVNYLKTLKATGGSYFQIRGRENKTHLEVNGEKIKLINKQGTYQDLNLSLEIWAFSARNASGECLGLSCLGMCHVSNFFLLFHRMGKFAIKHWRKDVPVAQRIVFLTTKNLFFKFPYRYAPDMEPLYNISSGHLVSKYELNNDVSALLNLDSALLNPPIQRAFAA